MFFLVILNIFWAILIFKVVIRTFKDGAAVDVRSDSEDTEDEINERKQKRKVLQKRRNVDRKNKPHED
jgi:hypothetical protein